MKVMKFDTLNPLLFILYSLVCISHQAICAESIAYIEYPGNIIKDDNELIHIQAVAQLSNITINGLKVSELSGLAWDADEKLLYSISDNGYLLSFRPVFEGGRLNDVLIIDSLQFHDDKGKKLRWKNSDSEGLTLINADNQIRGDTQYIVSFERQPRVIQYNRQGFIEKQITIPEKLRDISNYRSENKSLESIEIHDQYGLLLGTEYSLKGEDKAQLNLYTTDGKLRSFTAYFDDGAFTGLATMENNDLLAIERAYGGFFMGFKVALHHLRMEGDQLKDKVIARFLPAGGYFNDNFEGITKHEDGFYFMISDDNNHPAKRTLLVYFKYPE